MDNFKKESEKDYIRDYSALEEYYERNIGMCMSMPFIISFFTGPTAIILTVSVLVASKSFVITSIVAFLFMVMFIIFSICNYFIGKRYEKQGGYEMVSKPAIKNIFSLSKLGIFLVLVVFTLTIISKIEYTKDNIKGVILGFLGVYFIDLIITKIILYLKNEKYYDNNADKKAQHILEVLEVIVCGLSIIGYGLVIFPLVTKNYGYQIILYFSILVILAVVFSIVDHIVIKKSKKASTNTIEEPDCYYDVIEHWRIASILLLGFLHLWVIIMSGIALFPLFTD